ncbi:peptide chain release factor N(5)-glutamine methyltransferase [Salinarimonas rosea]|uniref:peptide chain release factor N(5)-glutamine methyltransferase n=1 Tax=Salinarimonas rosea TaxID=552063 RepID=UPI0003FB5750|nr:peptide chain release factor N(5)-glutamine methyltransferase [Salinarimonas rosea]
MALDPVALDPGGTRGAALAAVRGAFARAGLDEPALDARILVAEAAGVRPGVLLAELERPLGADATARLAGFAARRLAHEPVWRILGEAEFWGLRFRLAPQTLVPRPDTETLVETALALAPGRAPRILDLGTGSGCILVALLAERRDASGIGLDRSEEACRTARENARANGVGDRAAFVVGDWTGALAPAPGFDLVVSNPPYIPEGDLPGLAREVRAHDPVRALDGGADGLDAYRAILARGRDLLAPGGVLAVEVGIGQAEPVSRLGETHGLVFLRLARDLAGIPRIVVFGR